MTGAYVRVSIADPYPVTLDQPTRCHKESAAHARALRVK